jgi:TonB family protein
MMVAGARAMPAASKLPASSGWLATLQVALPWLVLAWGLGVASLGLRVARQWRRLRVLVRAAEALPAWHARAEQLGRRLGLRRAIHVLASVRIASPTLVGWLRPVVVLPVAMLAQMPAHQVDLILAHELAHLKRFDHLANLFQVVLETLFFYHPVVHWIARDARNERELCCDALALRVSGGQRRDFVEALAGLAEFRADHADLVLAASGGVLVERAWFIAGAPARNPHARNHFLVLLLALSGVAIALGVVAWRQHAVRQAHDDVLSSWSAPVIVPAPRLAMTGLAPSSRQVLRPLSLATLAESGGVPEQVSRHSYVAPIVSKVHLTAAAIDGLAVLPVSVPVARLLPDVVAKPPAPAINTMPQPLRVVAPVYPQQALANGTRGRVVVAFTLDAQGRPQDLAVVSASPSGVFNLAAVRAIRQWRFNPPALPGRRYRQAFSFTPEGAGGADVMDAEAGCYRTTGTHICRHVDGALPGVTTLRGIGH